MIILTEEKKRRGRPRKYQTEAEEHRAYRQRKKEKVAFLEKKIAELEKQSDKE
ncbi:MAG: hypothetical protein HZR80_17865 [Candidatus Heimdallarchaeota archaeon]